VRATFYVPTDAIDRQELLWPDRLGYALAWTADAGIDLDPLLEVAGVRDASAEVLAEAIKRLPHPEHLHALEIIDGWLSGLSAPSWGRMMRWEEVVALATQGHEIGGHSRTHPILPALDDEALAREILGCRERLTDVLGDRSAVRSFAYPNGDHDARARELVARAGFENAVTTRPSRTRAGHDPFQLGRFDLQQERNVGLLGRIDAPTLAFRLRDPDHSLESLLRTSG
jgi:peptidoglycan/xylan/chitin deacetylase (PgdA/CDA1 family)